MNDIEISYDDICLHQQYSELNSRNDVNINVIDYDRNIIKRNPIIMSPMVHTCTKEMLNYFCDNSMVPTLHRYFKTVEDQYDFAVKAFEENPEYINDVFFAVGRCKKWIDYLYNKGIRKYCVDMAHGYSQVAADSISYIKYELTDNIVMAGNIETGDGYEYLANAGADYIRVGISNGSICATHKNTGIGRPIISALIDCNNRRKKLYDESFGYYTTPMIIVDGGIRSAADIVKAIAVGANFAMVGKLIASTDLALGPFYNKDKELCLEYDEANYRYVEYAGMASSKMRLYNDSHCINKSIEGESGYIKYTGKTEYVINNIESNMKAALSYCGARNWLEFKNNAVVSKISSAGYIEKQTHLDLKD